MGHSDDWVFVISNGREILTHRVVAWLPYPDGRAAALVQFGVPWGKYALPARLKVVPIREGSEYATEESPYGWGFIERAELTGEMRAGILEWGRAQTRKRWQPSALGMLPREMEAADSLRV